LTHPETSDGLSGSPDLLLVNLVELLLEIISVCLSGVELERSSGLGTVSNRLVKSLEYGKVSPVDQRSSLIYCRGDSLLELGGPVESTSSSGGGTGVVHVVHTVLADQREEGLGSLLDGLVESLGGRVAVLSENLVLGEKHSLDTTHKLWVS
jgi:hypothetical protein